jgi:hypothetical protein
LFMVVIKRNKFRTSSLVLNLFHWLLFIWFDFIIIFHSLFIRFHARLFWTEKKKIGCTLKILVGLISTRFTIIGNFKKIDFSEVFSFFILFKFCFENISPSCTSTFFIISTFFYLNSIHFLRLP